MSTYSTTLRLELIGAGQQDGTWGDTTNTNLGDLIEAAITNVVDITFTDANYTLSANNGLPDEARNAVLNLIGTNTTTRNLVAPSVEKIYIVKNSTGASVAVTTGGGLSVTVPTGTTQIVWCDGTNFYLASGLTIAGTGISVSGATVSLANTAVTAGTYTSATLTVDAQGRLTSASSNTLGTMASQNANAVAITGGTIVGITDLAVADGGTGSSTASGARTNLGVAIGTDVLGYVAPGTSGNVLTSNGSAWTSSTNLAVGVGQTWQLPSRSLSTSYTNTTGRPIQVHVVIQGSGGGGGSTTTAVVDGTTISSGSMNNVSGGLGCVTHSFVVPDGSTYSVTAGGSSSIYISTWAELR